MAIQEVGTLRYGSLDFGPFTRTTSVSVRPEPTADGRSIKWNRFTLSFESHITGATAAEADATAIRCRQILTKTGLPFICTGRGIGDIRVNVGNVRDVDSGPKPQELSFDAAVGGDRVSKLRWTISFAIPECPDAAYKFRIADYSFVVQYSVQNGYTTRTIRGELVIPQNRLNNGERFPQDSADYYREQVVVPPPEGFKPVSGVNITLSKDRSTISFDYAHTEMGRNILPPGLVEWDMSQTMSTSTQFLVHGWQTTFSATGELAKDGQFRDAVIAFFTDVQARMGKFIQRPANSDPRIDTGGQKVNAIPIAFNATEPSIYGPRKINLSITYQSIADLDAVLNSSIWTKLPNQNRNSWRQWWLSVKDTAFHPRGYAKLVYDIGEDRITDLCDAGPQRPPAGQPPPPIQEIINKLVGGTIQITQKNSWIMYECSVTFESDSGNSFVRTMPDRSPTAADDPDYGADVYTTNVLTGGNILNTLGAGVGGNPANGGPFVGGRLDNQMVPNKAVRGKKPQWFVVIAGSAIRAGFAVPCPSIKEVNGMKVVPLPRADSGEGFSQLSQPGFISPIFYARWKFRYGIEGDLSKTTPTIPRNLMFPGEN